MRHRLDLPPRALAVGILLALGAGCGADEADPTGDPLAMTGDPLDTIGDPQDGTVAGCSVRDTWPEACDAVAIPGILVTVTDGVGGAPVCDATVTAFPHGSTTDGHTLEVNTFLDPCHYVDMWGQEGSWDLTATTPAGATGSLSGVTVCLRESGCHLNTISVTFAVE